jgi:hypothetical protein
MKAPARKKPAQAPVPQNPDTPRPVLQRHADWQVRLSRYLALVARMAPETGETDGGLDCATFAAGAVEAQTGVDLAAEWRGYTSLEDGFKRLVDAGFDDHVALVASLLEEVPVAAAGPGDIVALQLGRNLPSLGVVQGEFVYVLLDDRGRVTLRPRAEATRAFRVPA